MGLAITIRRGWLVLCLLVGVLVGEAGTAQAQGPAPVPDMDVILLIDHSQSNIESDPENRRVAFVRALVAQLSEQATRSD